MKTDDRWYICNEILRWLEAAEMTVELDIALSHKWYELNRNFDVSEDKQRATMELQKLSRDIITIRHFFLSSFQNSRRWVESLQEKDPEISGTTQIYLTEIEPARALRNMREHADEYLLLEKSKPNQRKDFIYQSTDSDNQKFETDATSDIENGDDVLLGGRLSRNALLGSARELKNYLETLINNYSRRIQNDEGTPT